MKNIFKTAVLASLLVLGSACTSDFEEINTDPDAYSSAPTTNMLAYSIRYAFSQYTDNLPGMGLWCGYASNREYIDDYSGYTPNNNTYGNKWYSYYFTHVQMQDIVDRTDDNETKNMHNVAKLMQVWCMLVNMDSFGDIPYTQAFKGAPEDGSVMKTPYDKQSDLYPLFLNKLKEIADSWAAGKGPDALGVGDLLFYGDVSKWQRFCNSLRLRYAMRISAVYPAAQGIVEEVLNNPSKYPVMETTAHNAYFWWDGSITDYFDRWYNTFYSRTDYCVSQILIDHLKAQDDPRLQVIAKPSKTDGEYRGGEHGYNSQSLPENNKYSLFGSLYVGSANGFGVIMKACDVYFIAAEAAMKGWNVPMTAEEAYNKAVTLSMEDNELDAATAEAYLAGKGKWDGSADKLYNEWWVGLFKDTQEAWTLYRRTGYPKYISTSVSSQTGGKQYPGAKAYQVWGNEHNDVPFRFPYPQNQYTYNKENVEAAAANVKDFCWGEQMWWDTRTGVK